tara:strand:- start:2249 stop:2551 length:303 start_codon:yes stop_codon:yes gene_type:complete
MKLESVTSSDRPDKKLKAIFKKDDGRTKTVHFGTNSNYVFNNKKTIRDRRNYRKRHGENPLEKKALRNPDTPATLSMELLWGDSRNLKTNIASYKRKWNV